MSTPTTPIFVSAAASPTKEPSVAATDITKHVLALACDPPMLTAANTATGVIPAEDLPLPCAPAIVAISTNPDVAPATVPIRAAAATRASQRLAGRVSASGFAAEPAKTRTAAAPAVKNKKASAASGVTKRAARKTASRKPATDKKPAAADKTKRAQAPVVPRAASGRAQRVKKAIERYGVWGS
ncbi:hypothetical protein EDC01DRAFT_787571 [Geopyxis carbonaria]|nr:hypothetical protein EDC01DRAFT_787571 [Geopyxis carbonaria]